MSKNETQQQVADLTVDSAADAISRYLHVADASGRRWLLPLSDCQSWTVSRSHVYQKRTLILCDRNLSRISPIWVKIWTNQLM